MIELRRRYNMVNKPLGLPPEYQEVKYLDNSENSSAHLVIPKIKKGFKGTITSKVAVPSNEVLLSAFKYKVAFGWTSGPQVAIAINNETMYWHNFTTSNYSVEIDKLYDVKLEIEGNTSNLFVDDVLTVINNTFDNNNSLYIFNTDRTNLPFFGKIYSIKIEGTENTDLIPCYRKKDNVAGMYDLVSGEFYTNAGTGSFIVGPDVIG